MTRKRLIRRYDPISKLRRLLNVDSQLVPAESHRSNFNCSTSHLLRSQSQTGRAGADIEDSEDGLEEDISEDGEADASVPLDAAEASAAGAVHGGVFDVGAWDCEGLSSDLHVEVGWGPRTGKCVS